MLSPTCLSSDLVIVGETKCNGKVCKCTVISEIATRAALHIRGTAASNTVFVQH